MAGRPYDLRHAAVSLWLNGGVSPTEIAKRAGHSLEVLLRVYAKCVHGQEEIANQRIEEVLSADIPVAGQAVPAASQHTERTRPTASRSHRDDATSALARLLANARATASQAQRER
jgi:hypothetical protein